MFPRVKHQSYTAITFSFVLLLAAGIAVFAGVNAQSGTPVTCTLTLAGNKTTYTDAPGEFVNYTYTCSRITSSVTVQVVKPDDIVTTYTTGYNTSTGTLGFGTSNLVPGGYTLRICIEKTSDIEGTSCPPDSIVAVPFTIVASPNTPPTVSLSVNTTNTAVSGYRPGVRAYFSMSATDDRELRTVVVTTSPMMYSGSPIDMTSQCQGKTFCEEKVYIIAPSNPGPQFVTVTATDNTGQTTTKTVNFNAVACTTDAECGGGSIQWAGATFCGSPDSSSLNSAIMQYGVAATCKSGGICDTSSQMLVKQQCAAGDVCGSYTSPTCMTKPQACIPNGEITYACSCGALTVVPPSYWERFCCVNYSGGTQYTSHDICPPAPSSSSFSSPISFSSSSLVQRSASSSIVTSTSQTSTPSVSPVLQGTAPPAVPAAALSPGVRPAAQPSPRAETGSAVQATPSGQEKRMSKSELQREWKSLKGKANAIQKKLASVERNITSFEKKMDAKLRFLDRVKRKDVQKRVTVQIERWEKKVASLEEQKEKLEQTLGELRERWEEMKAVME